MSNLFAFTALGSAYPGFVSINRDENGDVAVTVRGAPTVHEDRSYICGFKEDKGQPGRCTAGDDACNNYCNMAPEKGLMQNRPAPCSQTIEGKTATFTVPAAEWAKLQPA
jgi:hypothetical protein